MFIFNTYLRTIIYDASKHCCYIFIYRLCGVDIQSQAAYELAVKGLLRPTDSNIPMIYTVKCIDFSPPEFMLGKYMNIF